LGYLDSGVGVLCLPLLLESVAVASDVDDGGSVQQPVERSGGGADSFSPSGYPATKG